MAGMFVIAVIKHHGNHVHLGYRGSGIGELKLSELGWLGCL
jgi:hypothetical protein